MEFLILVVLGLAIFFGFTFFKDGQADKYRTMLSDQLIRKLINPNLQNNAEILRLCRQYASSYAELLDYFRKPEIYDPSLVDIDSFIEDIEAALWSLEKGDYSVMQIVLSRRSRVYPIEETVEEFLNQKLSERL